MKIERFDLQLTWGESCRYEEQSMCPACGAVKQWQYFDGANCSVCKCGCCIWANDDNDWVATIEVKL
jgi:hypothetical protein